MRIKEMTLNFHTEYAFRVIIYLLSYPDQVIPTREIAEKYNISVNHLNKVSQRLVVIGVVTSLRGRGGGILLKEEAKEMKIGDLMKSIEPQNELAQCDGGKGLGACVISPVCKLRGILAEAQQEFWEKLNESTISDLAESPAKEIQAIWETPKPT